MYRLKVYHPKWLVEKCEIFCIFVSVHIIADLIVNNSQTIYRHIYFLQHQIEQLI